MSTSEDARLLESLPPEAFVEYCYAQILNRHGDDQGLSFHLGALQEGAPRLEIVRSFLECPEHQKRFRAPISTSVPPDHSSSPLSASASLVTSPHDAPPGTVTVRTKQGLLTIAEDDDAIGAALCQTKQYEFDSSLRAVKFLKDSGFIPAGKVNMLDVGANIGIISIGLVLANQVDLAVAIEPESFNFSLLRRNIEQNGLSARILGLQMAAGDKTSTLTMELSPNNRGDHRIREVPAPDASERFQEQARRVIQVKSLPLPQILALPQVHEFGLSSPSFMWIDVQGYEGHVFQGAGSLLERGLPTVSEIWPYGVLRAGMSLGDFAGTVAGVWTDYWIERRDRFIRYPVTVFDRYLEELGGDGHFENVIFTRRP